VADESPRSRAARDAAERALIRVVHHYGPRAGPAQRRVRPGRALDLALDHDRAVTANS